MVTTPRPTHTFYLSFYEKYGKIINNGAKDLAITNEFKTGILLDVL